MSTTWKTVRVFISSTFRDMQAERDWLVRFVFPKLREELVKFRIHLVDVDLRWGVTGDQDALDVCREVIDECYPRFLCMLGGRYGWVPDGRDKSITEDEICYGVLGRETDKRGHAFFYFRDDGATARMVEEKPGDFREPHGSESALKLEGLKKVILEAGLSPCIYGAEAKWDAAQKRLIGLEKFGEQVHSDLLKSLKDDPKLAERFRRESTTQPDEFSEEADQMDAFVEEHTDRYVTGSREPLLGDLLAFAAADGAPNILVLSGEPGSGKSALLAKINRDLEKTSSGILQSALVISHFVGASIGSTDLRRTFRRLCHELARAAGNTEPLPFDIEEIIAHFQKLLSEVATKKRIILIFDALDQLNATDGAQWLNWLPRELPPAVRIVASVIAPGDGQPDHQALSILRNRPGTRVERLKPLTEADALQITEDNLRRYAKRLSPEQLAALLAKPASRLPLYVLTALEELRTLGTYEEITERIRKLPGDTRALFGWILAERLARDPGFRDREGRPCGARFVEEFAACLAVSRHGLSPAELTALLDPGDPQGNVAALLRLLRPYLMRRGELLDFYHSQFRSAAVATFLDTPERQRNAHQSVAARLQAFADPHRDEKCRDATPHALSELSYHQTHAEAWPDLITTLENIFFLEAKVTHGMAFDLVEDFGFALKMLPKELLERQVLSLFEEALRRELHFIVRHARDYPQALFQCLWNNCHPSASVPIERPWSGRLTKLLEQCIRTGMLQNGGGFWLKSLTPPRIFPGSAQIAVMRGHTRGVTCISFSKDGRHMATSGGYDHTVRIWDVSTGRELLHLWTNQDFAACVAFSPDGNFVASGTNENVRVWNLPEGRGVAILRGHKHGVTSIAFSPDSRVLSTGGLDETIRIWDTNGWDGIAVLSEHQNSITSLAFSRDGLNLASGSNDGTIRVWSTSNWEKVAVLGSGVDRVNCISFSPDGRRMASGSESKSLRDVGGTVRIWDIMTGTELAVLRKHTNAVTGVAFVPDGRTVVTTSLDATILLWHVDGDLEPAVLVGHDAGIICLALSPDGQTIASGSSDHTARLWDLERAKSLNPPALKENSISSITLSSDGRLAATARWRDTSIDVWDMSDGRKIRVLVNDEPVEDSDTAESIVNGIAFISCKSYLASVSSDSTIRIWDSATGVCVSKWWWYEASDITSLAISPDGRLLATGSHYRVAVWEIATGRHLHTLWCGYTHADSLAFSPDGRFLSSQGECATNVWDVANGNQISRFAGVTNSAFARDGEHLAIKMLNGDIQVVDTVDFKVATILRGQKYFGREIAFSPDGLRVVSGPRKVPLNPDGEFVHVWNAVTGEICETIHGQGDVSAIANGAAQFPFRAIARSGETVVEHGASGIPAAFFPDSLLFLTAHPDGRTWAGAVGSHLILLRLEAR